jgi:hypothetical protein
MRTTSKSRIRVIAVVVASTGLVAIGTAGTASARPEPAPPAAVVSDPGLCPLTRVGDQFTRCDDLTGAGVPAPAWIPEQE